MRNVTTLCYAPAVSSMRSDNNPERHYSIHPRRRSAANGSRMHFAKGLGDCGGWRDSLRLGSLRGRWFTQDAKVVTAERYKCQEPQVSNMSRR